MVLIIGYDRHVSDRTTVIVGAGSSGAALAARVSESPEERVILIEAGPDYPTQDDLPESLRDPFNPRLAGHDWGLTAYPIEPSAERPAGTYARGKVVGGSSMVNGAVTRRGTPDDFAGWAAAGNPSWGWVEVLSFYRALENDDEFGAAEFHGDGGDVPIMRYGREQWAPFVQAFGDACVARGFPWCEDQNAPGTTGFGPLPRNQRGDRRAAAAYTHLQGARARPNLEILAETTTLRVRMDGRRATGVVVEREGGIEEVDADRVVLSAGVAGSPQLLILSGIGPGAELERLGIEKVVDLPGVGRNLYDTGYVPIVGIASDQAPPLCGVRAELKYSSDGGENDILVVPCLFEPDSVGFEVPGDPAALIILVVTLARPRSTGWIEIVSPDPKVAPEIHLNYLAERADVERLRDATRLVYDLCQTPEVAAEIGTLLTPTESDLVDDASLESWMRANVQFGNHATSTCAMGPASDPSAVVGDGLAVHGTEALYVADASIMPRMTTGWVGLTCVMIGERAAALLA